MPALDGHARRLHRLSSRAARVRRRSAGLRWIDSPASDAHARRGFCGECGSSLFWDAPGRDYVAIAAGSLDGHTGLRVVAHWYTSQKGDWYELPDDGLPRHEQSASTEGVVP